MVSSEANSSQPVPRPVRPGRFHLPYAPLPMADRGPLRSRAALRANHRHRHRTQPVAGPVPTASAGNCARRRKETHRACPAPDRIVFGSRISVMKTSWVTSSAMAGLPLMCRQTGRWTDASGGRAAANASSSPAIIRPGAGRHRSDSVAWSSRLFGRPVLLSLHIPGSSRKGSQFLRVR